LASVELEVIVGFLCRISLSSHQDSLDVPVAVFDVITECHNQFCCDLFRFLFLGGSTGYENLASMSTESIVQ